MTAATRHRREKPQCGICWGPFTRRNPSTHIYSSRGALDPHVFHKACTFFWCASAIQLGQRPNCPLCTRNIRQIGHERLIGVVRNADRSAVNALALQNPRGIRTLVLITQLSSTEVRRLQAH